MAKAPDTPSSASFLQRLQAKTRLSVYVSIVVGITTGLCIFVFSYLALKVLRENKVRDIVMILHYDADYLTKQLAREFNNLDDIIGLGRIANKKYKAVVYDPKSKKYRNVVGMPQPSYTPDEIGIPAEGPPRQIHVVNLNGNLYLAKRGKDIPWIQNLKHPEAIVLLDFEFGMLARALDLIRSDSMTYLVSANGRLLFSNSPEVSQATLSRRPITKKFIESPLASAQMRYTDARLGEVYGFFSSVDDANIVVFVETSEKVITDKIDKIKLTFLYYTAGILVGAIILLNLGMTSVYATLRRLSGFAQRISRGDFHIAIKPTSFGELNALSSAFSSMTHSLILRDQQIAQLIEKERQGALTQQELSIARQIQDSFLPKPDMVPPPAVSLAFYYMPAGFVAGDWYAIHEDPIQQKLYLIIADVSGHGAGSSMYTAMIAALFELAREDHFKSMPILQFFHQLNTILLRLGKHQWHSSMLCAEIFLQEKRLILTNAGHMPPILYQTKGDVISAKPISLRSDLLGLQEKANITQKELSLASGDGLFLYTDGLVEARNAAGKAYSSKRLVNLIKDHRNKDSHRLVDMLRQDLMSYIPNPKTEDDVCLISFRFQG